MKLTQVLAGVLILLLLVGLLGGGCALQGYNQAVRLDENVNQAWGEVDNQLKRRDALVPQLVATVEGVANQEQAVFLGIAEARKSYFKAETIDEKQVAARQMDSALSRLLLLQENYPQLKSNESFLKLQDSLEGTENRLTVARKNFNLAVQDLNAYTRQLPGKFFAAFAGITGRKYIEADAEERKNPKVDFSDLKREKAAAKPEPKTSEPTTEPKTAEPPAEEDGK